MEIILVSACLLGFNCRYDGNNNKIDNLEEKFKDYILIPICPEQLGGLSTPRDASEIKEDKVIQKNGKDVTDNFISGANEVLKYAKNNKINKAILKSKSPSCGITSYDGTFTKTLINRPGITAKLLMDNNIKIISSDEIE